MGLDEAVLGRGQVAHQDARHLWLVPSYWLLQPGYMSLAPRGRVVRRYGCSGHSVYIGLLRGNIVTFVGKGVC